MSDPLEGLVVKILEVAGIMKSQAIRDRLMDEGFFLNINAFYSFMRQMECEGFVESWLVKTTVRGLPAKEKWYRLRVKATEPIAL